MKTKPPLLYCAGPYTASTPQEVLINIKKAMDYGYQLRAMGLIPFVPHHAILPTRNYEEAMRECLVFVSRADALLMLPGWQGSPGAVREYEHALTLQKLIFHSISEVEEYIR